MRANLEPGSFDHISAPNQVPPGSIGNPGTARISGARRVPFVERPTCTVAEACHAAGLGRTKLYELFKDDAIESFTVGRRRLVKVPSLLKFLGSGQP